MPDDRAADLAGAEQALYNPRSFLAQSVPERMAIMSAGVVMNLLFALVTAAVAYGIGVQQIACVVGGVFPGEAAWRAGLRAGDRVEQIAGRPVGRFDDLRWAVSLGNIDNGVPMVIRRPRVAQPIDVRLFPDRNRGRPVPTVGIVSGHTTTLQERDPVQPGTAAAAAHPAFQGGDRIIRIDQTPIVDSSQINAYLAQHPDKTLQVTVERHGDRPQSPGGPPGPVQEATIEVPPAPMRELGVVMAMGPVRAVQDGSPAAEAGIRPGDEILAIDGESAGDPATLPDRLRVRAEKEPRVRLSIHRPDGPLEVPVKLRLPQCYDSMLYGMVEGLPVTADALGIAYPILNRVEAVEPGGPAARAGLRRGDMVAQAKLVPPAQAPDVRFDGEDYVEKEATVKFSEKTLNWPFLALGLLQFRLPGNTVVLTLADGRTLSLEPATSSTWFNPERGLLFQAASFEQKAHSLGQAVDLGARETWDAVTAVFRFLSKIGRQVSVTGLAGPLGIVQYAAHEASRGITALLMFLTLISANLAVLNFLPIPVLDGGHMVFLAYEGVTGKPPNERIHLALTYVGLIFILSLMVYALGLDLTRLFGG
jgi:regulator of sigma E protease